MASAGDEGADDPGELPSTAYAVLATLIVTQEELTVGEIKIRAGATLGPFYWSPAVSHIRRELRRLLPLGLVQSRTVSLGAERRSQVYTSTEAGEQFMARWVGRADTDEQVVVKNSVLLRVVLGALVPVDDVVTVVDARLRKVQQDIDWAVWGQRRAKELGLDDQDHLRYSMAVAEYMLRSMYFEQANLRQLRDHINGFDTEAFRQDRLRKRGPLRPRPRPSE